jgi:hypothetical protein
MARGIAEQRGAYDHGRTRRLRGYFNYDTHAQRHSHLDRLAHRMLQCSERCTPGSDFQSGFAFEHLFPFGAHTRSEPADHRHSSATTRVIARNSWFSSAVGRAKEFAFRDWLQIYYMW